MIFKNLILKIAHAHFSLPVTQTQWLISFLKCFEFIYTPHELQIRGEKGFEGTQKDFFLYSQLNKKSLNKYFLWFFGAPKNGGKNDFYPPHGATFCSIKAIFHQNGHTFYISISVSQNQNPKTPKHHKK